MGLLWFLAEVVGGAAEAAIDDSLGGAQGRRRRRGVRRSAGQRGAPRVGGALLAYQKQTGISQGELVAWLGCSLTGLETLKVSLRPLLSSGRFREDVTALAQRTGANPERLAELLLVTPELPTD